MKPDIYIIEICPKSDVYLGVTRKCGLQVGHDGHCEAVCKCGYRIRRGSDGWHKCGVHQ